MTGRTGTTLLATACVATLAIAAAGCAPKPVAKAPPATNISADAAAPTPGAPAADM